MGLISHVTLSTCLRFSQSLRRPLLDYGVARHAVSAMIVRVKRMFFSGRAALRVTRMNVCGYKYISSRK